MGFADLEWYQAAGATIDALYREELHRPAEWAGAVNWLYHAREHPESVDAEWIRARIRESSEWHAIHDKPALPPIPSREDVCSVRLHFQGVTYDLSIGQTKDVLLWGLSDADRAVALQTKKAIGDRHVVVALAAKYYNFSIGQPWDYTRNLKTCKARLRELIVGGFVPLFSLSMDGQTFNPDGNTYGWQWGMDNMPRIISALAGDGGSECPDGEDLTPYILFFHGFELVAPPGGNWTPDQFEQAVLLFRGLLPHGHLAAEIGGYAWWGEGASRQGQGPVAVWNDAAGMGIDVALGEWANPGDRERADGMEQIAARWLGPEARNIHAKNAGPWYWPNPTPRGPRYAVAFEFALAAWVRGQCTLADIQDDRAALHSLGFTWVC